MNICNFYKSKVYNMEERLTESPVVRPTTTSHHMHMYNFGWNSTGYTQLNVSDSWATHAYLESRSYLSRMAFWASVKL
jgi:hypothetical protein